MIGLLSIVALGFFLGMRHATDPDHVIAVTTIVARHRSIRPRGVDWRALGRGAYAYDFGCGRRDYFAGVGDSGARGAFDGIFRGIDADSSGHHESYRHYAVDQFEFFSARLGRLRIDRNRLILIRTATATTSTLIRTSTILTLIRTMPRRKRRSSWLDRHFGQIGLYQVARPLVVGLVHGLAGSAAVALLVLTTIRNPKWAVAYLLVFGVGTIAGMMLITGAIGAPLCVCRQALRSGLTTDCAWRRA